MTEYRAKVKSGITPLFSKNKGCGSYLGVHIAEQVLSKVFENVQRMPITNPGYDFICKRGYKIDVKSSCLSKGDSKGMWKFHINNNRTADYFLFLAFDNRVNLNPLHIWLVKGDEMIKTSLSSIKLNEKGTFEIRNTLDYLENYRKYEQTEKLGKLVDCCTQKRNGEV
ncbi:MAG: hypothetical protein WA130_07300 [Candidatus Methanoperedens sp.]